MAAARSLEVLAGDFGVCSLPPTASLPPGVAAAAFSCVVHSADELSVLAPFELLAKRWSPSGPWRALRVDGPLAHDLVGVLASLAVPLAEAGVAVFAVSTFATDYVLVPAARCDDAVAAVRAVGWAVRAGEG